MDFKLSDEQELLLENIRELYAREFPESYWAECDAKHELPVRWHKVLVENDLALLGVPEEYGGTEIDKLTQMMVVEEYVKLGAPIYLCANSYRLEDILMFGTKEQIVKAMEAAKESPISYVLGISEPQAGSDAGALSTTATRKNGKVYINGHKTFISHALQCKYMLTMTKDEDTKKMSMWWTPLDAPGVKIEEIKKIGLFMSSTCDIYLDNVEVEEKDLVGVEGEGFIQLMKNFEIERLLLAAGALGMAEAAFEDAARFANQRVQFGKKIGEFQLIHQKLLLMKTKIENMKSHIYKTAWDYDNGNSIRIGSGMAKLYCCQSAFEVVDDAMQILGGIGYTVDHRVSRLWRDCRVLRMTGGTDEIMVHAAGRALLKEYSN